MTILRYLFLLGGLISLISLVPSGIWAQGTDYTGQDSADEAGTLQVLLALTKNPVIYQEDVECVVMLKNTGTSSLVMKLPALDRSMPIVRIKSLSSGETKEYQRSENSSPQILRDLTFAAGAVMKVNFSLFDIVSPLSPDLYGISLLWRYDNGKKTTESNSVQLVVLPD